MKNINYFFYIDIGNNKIGVLVDIKMVCGFKLKSQALEYLFEYLNKD